MKRIVSLFVLLFTLAACGGDSDDQPQPQQAANSSSVVAQPAAISPESTRVLAHRADSIRVDSLGAAWRADSISRAVADSVYRVAVTDSVLRCLRAPGLSPDSLEEITLGGFTQFMSILSRCDTYRVDFTLDGEVSDSGYTGDGRGSNLIARLQSLAENFKPLRLAYENLPGPARRAMTGPALHLVADEAVKYLNREQLNFYLLRYDWNRDIDAISPSWYEHTEWPEDRMKPIPVHGFQISKVDLWTRMFWRRRGQALFIATQSAVREALQHRHN